MYVCTCECGRCTHLLLAARQALLHEITLRDIFWLHTHTYTHAHCTVVEQNQSCLHIYNIISNGASIYINFVSQPITKALQSLIILLNCAFLHVCVCSVMCMNVRLYCVSTSVSAPADHFQHTAVQHSVSQAPIFG